MPRERRDGTANAKMSSLYRSESLCRALLESAPDVLIVLIEGGRIVECNAATLTLLACRKDQVIGQTPAAFAPRVQPDGQDTDTKAEQMLGAALGGVTQTFEWRHRRLDGLEFDVEVRLSRLEGVEPPILLSVARDVTSLKLTERASERATQRLRELSESLRDGFASVALDGRITECNRAFLVMMGLTLEEARQLTYQDLTPERWHAQEAKIIAEQVRVRGYSDIYEKEYRRKDGTIFPIELQTYLTLDEHDQPNGMWAFMRDISDRKRTEMALNESAQKYQALVEATDTGVVILGPGAKVLDANPAYVRLTGRERLDEILGRSVMEWTAPPQRELSADGIRRCLEDESPFTVELDYVSPRGRLTPIELNATVARSEGGDQVLALCRDITERKRAEAERERLIAEANAANSAKDQFLAVLSHELRNPLAAIHAGIELLRRTAAADNPQVMRVLEIVERNARLQARLVGDLLDLSRIARGKITLQPTVVKLDDLVLSAVHACQADAERASVHLEFRTDVALWVYADSDRLQQVVVNLVQNGVKFTPAGGRVIVTVARAESRVRIVVEDTGIGIEASRLPQLFQMFQQGQVGARRAPGLGIGLALVRSLTEMQHGKVWAESPGPGLGSRFTVELHLTDSPETRSTCEASEPARRAAKLLLVEDNPDTLVVMAEALAALGYEVVPAASGEEALDLLAARPVDAVIADIELPGIDGYEFLRRARRLPGTAGVPAFAATGYGQQSDAQRALEAGFTAHLVKPVDLKILDQRVRSALAGSARSRPVSGSGKAEGEPRELPVEVGDELRAVHRP